MAPARARLAFLALLLPMTAALTAAVPSASGGTEPTMEVTPAKGLSEVQDVTVTVRDLAPNQDYLVFECPVDPPVPCANEVAVDFTTDGNGDAFDVPVTVHRRFVRELDQTYVIDCLEQPCRLRTYNFDGAVNASAPITFARIRSRTAFEAARSAKKLLVSGTVAPVHEPVDETVRVALDRRKAGKWRRVANKATQLYHADGKTRFAASLGRRSGKCRITVKYTGTHRYAPSKAVRKLRC